jgi:hypothetical protein
MKKPQSWKHNSGLNSISACCHSVQNVLFSLLLTENVKLEMCKVYIILYCAGVKFNLTEVE